MIANQAIVIDNGSGLIKAGFAGNSLPKCVYPNIIGRPKHKKVMAGGLQDTVFVGHKVEEHRGLLSLRYPINKGVIEHWDDMERIWRHIYSSDQLNAESEDHPVLLTEPPLNPRKNREKTAEILFETFNIPALHFSLPSVLCLYASGKTTGLVLDCGDGVCQAVPVYQGFAVNHSVMRGYVAGRDVTRLLRLLLQKDGYIFNSTAEFEILRTVKENVCYVNETVCGQLRQQQGSEDMVAEQCGDQCDGRYLLPDNTEIQVSSSRWFAPELLFRPSIIGCESMGVQELVYNAFTAADLDLRNTLSSSIVLSGGSTLFKGFGNRLLAEMERLFPNDTDIQISAPKERTFSAWIGGSILACLETFNRMMITRQDYDKEGVNVVHRKQM